MAGIAIDRSMKASAPESLFLDEADVRAMVHLLGEVAALPGEYAEKKRYLMEGLCRIAGADAWVWGLAAEMDPKKLPVYVGFQHGGFEEKQFARFLAIQTSPVMISITESYSRDLLLHPQRQLTRTLQQIVDSSRWNDPSVRSLWDPCGLHPRCLSFHPLGDGKYSGIALYRALDKPLLTDRESRIVHILMTEIPWLHRQGWPEDHGAEVPRLTTRERLVLEMLLQGYGRGRIAAHLGISVHTVSGYVKKIHSHFGVQSRAQLVSRFFRGDGGDQALTPP